MALTGYEDYIFSSDSEMERADDQQYLNTFTADQSNGQGDFDFGFDFDDGVSAKGSNQGSESERVHDQQYLDTFTADQDNGQGDFDFDEDASDEGDDSSHTPDVDEYASFNTDLEKYHYDQMNWHGIQNDRKYKIVKKENVKKPRQAKAKKGDKPQRNTKHSIERKKQDKPKALPKAFPKPKRKGKSKAEAPVELAGEIPKDGEIHFDVRENLWYSYKKGDVYISERATFHHWIRADLAQSENAKGTYAFGRKRGSGNYDITCFNEVEKHWGLQRSHYAPVMFEWERLNRADPTYALDSLYHQGLLVIDYWHRPVRNFREIPLVISSAFEGGFIEPATRLHSEMTYEDMRARMPPFTQITSKGTTRVKALSKSSTLSGRARRFREIAGAISWELREGSGNIKVFIEDLVKPILNSTHGSRDLTRDEGKKLRLMNLGTKPGRSKQGTSQASKHKYKAFIEKAAGLKTNYMDDRDDLYEDPEDRILRESMVFIQDNDNPEGMSMLADVSDDAAPRFVFRLTEAPFLQAMTEKEALMHPLVDNTDPRNQVPKLSNEVDAIRDALKVTVDHFKEIFGVEPTMYEGSNYISEYCNIQDQVDEFFGDDATALRRLERWEGTMFDWEQAEVEDAPCVGRKRPFDLPADFWR